MRMSRAALRPSVEMTSMLSSFGDTLLAATFSARSPRCSMNRSSSTVGCTATVAGARFPSSRSARSGVGRSRSSAVFTSAKIDHIFNISGTLENFANRVFMRKELFPVGAISICVTVCPKVAAHASNDPIPAFSSRSGRRYRCITNASVTLLEIGVAVAAVTTRSRPWLRRYSSFMCRSLARPEPSMEASRMFDSVARFLYMCASSTMR